MAIKRVWIEEGCIACGNCESVAPEIFKVTDQSHVIDNAPIDKYEIGRASCRERVCQYV